MKKTGFLLILVLFFVGCGLFGPTDSNPVDYVDVDMAYQRVNDTPNCPVIRESDSRVYLSVDFVGWNNQLVNEGGIYTIKVNKVVAARDMIYTLRIFDYAFAIGGDTECTCDVRAHIVFINILCLRVSSHSPYISVMIRLSAEALSSVNTPILAPSRDLPAVRI